MVLTYLIACYFFLTNKSNSTNTSSCSSLLSADENNNNNNNNNINSIKIDIIKRLSDTLTKTNFTVNNNNDSDIEQKNYYRNQIKNEINRIKTNNEMNNNNSNDCKRVSSLRSNFELNRQVSYLNDPTKPSQNQSRSFKLLQETLDNG
jgi:hypothetical protein